MIIVMIKSQRGGGVRGNLSVTLGTPRNVPILTVSLPDDDDDDIDDNGDTNSKPVNSHLILDSSHQVINNSLLLTSTHIYFQNI